MISGNWTGLVAGILIVLAGIVMVFGRKRVAKWNAEQLRASRAPTREAAAKNSTPERFLLIGIGFIVFGGVTAWSCIVALR
ncbi:hypothetical protein [Subtercola endophyticus]|uniref:hypothetical protein n=1 Tax=Subtercola endophyticus TaxID=2895559 RepID=UPI001E44DEE0|nr:hypothetical protein [Subtercola endophyticus]UFS58697.1 hypothetical protein LQ955_17130 [Subtercola endophyticus]